VTAFCSWLLAKGLRGDFEKCMSKEDAIEVEASSGRERGGSPLPKS